MNEPSEQFDIVVVPFPFTDRPGTQEAIGYNSLVISWSEITRLASEMSQRTSIQTTLLQARPSWLL